MAGKTKRAIRNTAIQVGAQAVTWTLSWVLLVVLPRYLGDAGFGKLFFAISYGTIFSAFINLGVNTYVVREVAVMKSQHGMDGGEKRREKQVGELIGNVFCLKITLAIIVYAIMSGLIYLLPYEDLTRQAVLIIGASTCLGAVTLTLGGVFQGFESMSVPSIALILEKIIITTACVLLLMSGYSLLSVCWVYLAGAVANFIVTFLFLFRKIPFGFNWKRDSIRKIFLGGLPFFIWIIFGEIYVRIDVLMLSQMTSDAVVGWYGAAFRLYSTLLFIPHILNTSIFPAMSRMGADKENWDDFAKASRRVMNLMLFIAVPTAAGTILIADPILVLLYGISPFQHAGPCLKLFGVSILLVCVDVLLGSILIARGKEKQWAYMAILAAIFNVLLNIFAIPLTQKVYGNGGIGAAASTVLTEGLLMAGAFYLMPSGILYARNIGTFIRSGILSLVMVIGLTFIPLPHMVWTVVAGALFYLIFSWIIRVLPREDFEHIRYAILKER